MAQTIETFREQFLACEICTQQYDEDSRTPRILPCRHVFCESCLCNLVENARISCPKCRAIHELKTSDVSSLHKENTIRSIRDFFNQDDRSNQVSCGLCQQNQKAESMCINCEVFLCTSCGKSHSEERDRDETHVIKDISDVIMETKSRIRASTSGLEEQVKHLSEYKEDTLLSQESLQKELREALQNIGKDCDRILQFIFNRRNSFQQSVQKQLSKLNEQIENKLTNVEEEIDIKKMALDFASQTAEMSLVDFIKSSATTLKRLETAKKTHINRPMEDRTIVVKADLSERPDVHRILGTPYFDITSPRQTEIQTFPGTQSSCAIVGSIICRNKDGRKDSMNSKNIQAKVQCPDGTLRRAYVISNYDRTGVICFTPRDSGKHILQVKMPFRLAEKLSVDIHEDLSSKVIRGIRCPHFTVDVRAVHRFVGVSEDGRTLTRVKEEIQRGERQLQNYKGGVGTIGFDRTRSAVYYQVKTKYYLKQTLKGKGLLFEIGLCARSCIDNQHLVSGQPYALTCQCKKCNQHDSRVCIAISLGYDAMTEMTHAILTKNTVGTMEEKTLGIYLDVRRRVWIVVDVSEDRIISRIKNINVDEPLWPVFGMYNYLWCYVTLTVQTGKDIEYIPTCVTEPLLGGTCSDEDDDECQETGRGESETTGELIYSRELKNITDLSDLGAHYIPQVELTKTSVQHQDERAIGGGSAEWSVSGSVLQVWFVSIDLLPRLTTGFII